LKQDHRHAIADLPLSIIFCARNNGICRTSKFSPSGAGQVQPDDARPFEVHGKKQAVRAQITKRSSNCGAKAVSLVP